MFTLLLNKSNLKTSDLIATINGGETLFDTAKKMTVVGGGFNWQRKTLEYETLAERFNACVASIG
jgi:hypothetical protein